MNTNEHELILKEEVFDVVGCAMEVLNELGLKNIPVQQQSRYKLMYKGVQVGEYVPDLITHKKLVSILRWLNGSKIMN